MSEILVSACLLGRPCRYDGAARPSLSVERFLARSENAGVRRVPVCPEELGGLDTPRPAAELRGGNGDGVWDGSAHVVRLEDGQDVSEAFMTGARSALSKAPRAERAILKARSPSCGCRQVWIDGAPQAGRGVFAALLVRKGIQVCSDEEL